jgi:glycosyltransferase involved in cell wall biosynthesis
MRVLMTVDAVGGVWTYAMELVRALAPHGVEVTLAALGPNPSPAQAAVARSLRNADLVSFGGRLEWMEEPWADVERNGERLLALADECTADLVHVNGYAHATLPWGRPVVVVAHSCVTTWWRAVHGEDPPAAWREYRDRVAAGLLTADAVVTPTAAFLARLREAYGDVQRSHVIRNGVGAGRVPARRSAMREPVVFACGRLWDDAKGMGTLDAAARGLAWRVKLAGERVAPDGRTFTPLAAELVGALTPTEVADRVARAALFAHPSLYEPFGLAPLEAARAGCALLLSDLPELRELWSGAATFVPPGDVGAWHRALGQAIADAPARRASAAAARERAAEFSAESMAAAYRRLDESLLHGAPTKRAVA